MLMQLVVIVAGAFLGAVANGAVGFAFVIIVTMFWVHVLSPIAIVTLAGRLRSILHIASVWHFRKQIILGWLALPRGSAAGCSTRRSCTSLYTGRTVSNCYWDFICRLRHICHHTP